MYQPEYEHYEQTINNVINDVDIIDVDNHIFNDVKRLSNAKNKTAEYYNENPGSYAINYPTDAILVELDDIIKQLKAGDENIIKSV